MPQLRSWEHLPRILAASSCLVISRISTGISYILLLLPPLPLYILLLHLPYCQQSPPSRTSSLFAVVPRPDHYGIRLIVNHARL